VKLCDAPIAGERKKSLTEREKTVSSKEEGKDEKDLHKCSRKKGLRKQPFRDAESRGGKRFAKGKGKKKEEKCLLQLQKIARQEGRKKGPKRSQHTNLREVYQA